MTSLSLVRRARLDLRLSQTEVADRANVQRGLVSRLERRAAVHPNAQALGRIADVLGLRPSDIAADLLLAVPEPAPAPQNEDDRPLHRAAV